MGNYNIKYEYVIKVEGELNCKFDKKNIFISVFCKVDYTVFNWIG